MACFAALLFAAVAAAGEAELSAGRIYNKDQTWWLDLAFKYDFDDEVLEALQNGVPLTVDLDLEVRDDDAWIWEPSVMQRRIRLQIYYHALAQRYQIKNIGSESQISFSSRSAALDALGELVEILLVTDGELEAGKQYIVTAKTTLNIESLPVPLRPSAYLSPQWYVSSDSYEWKIEN